MVGYIYKTTNLINKKIYIGKKSSTYFLGSEYLGSGRYIRNAIKKYGRDNFIVELVESIDRKEVIDEREQYWISFYNSTDKDIGYNISKGGDGGDTFSNLSEEEKIERKLKLSITLKNKDEEYWKKRSTKRLATMKDRNIELGGWKKGNIPWNKGHTKESDERVAINALHSGLSRKGKSAWNKGLTKETSESLMHTSLSMKGKKNGLGNKSTKGYVCMNNGIKNTCVKLSEVNNYLEKGWVEGKIKYGHIKTYNSIRIKCLTNNKIYNSISQVVDELHIYPFNIKKSINNKIPVKGYLFERVDDN